VLADPDVSAASEVVGAARLDKAVRHSPTYLTSE
jgi:hypothetical protein